MRDRDATHTRCESRSRAFPLACVSLILLLCSCTRTTRTDPAEVFATDIQVQGTGSPALVREFPAGVYLLEIREHEIDLRVSVDAGGHHSELKDQVPRHGALYEVVSLKVPGQLQVQVAS